MTDSNNQPNSSGISDSTAHTASQQTTQLTMGMEMPSVTQLLCRKKLELASRLQGGPPAPETAAAVPPPFPPELQAELNPASQDAPQAIPVKLAGRKRPPLTVLSQEILAEAEDPFHQSLFKLTQAGVSQALLFVPPKGTSQCDETVPFIASFAISPGKHAELWQGLSLNQSLAPELWNVLIQAGFIELPAPSASVIAPAIGNADSAGFIRKALGLGDSEWLVLVRCGSTAVCTGLLALISPVSVVSSLVSVFRPSSVKQAA